MNERIKRKMKKTRRNTDGKWRRLKVSDKGEEKDFG